MAMENPILRQQDNLTTDPRYRGHTYDLQRPRISITEPIVFRADDWKYRLPNSHVKGRVLPPNSAKDFYFRNEKIRENKNILKLLDKTSAEVYRRQRLAEEQNEFLKLHREERQRQELKRLQEEEDELRQLKTYFPFEKPRYGAPGSGNFRKTSKPWNEGVGIAMGESNTSLPRSDWSKSVPPDLGRHCLRRYEDGQILRHAFSRETAAEYKKDLDELQAIKRRNEEKARSLYGAREKDTLLYDPFGKPGAGAPNRDEKGRALRRRSISRTFVNHPIDATRAQQAQEKKQTEKENDKEEEFDEPRAIKKQNEEKVRSLYGAREKDILIYDPFGRPGAGAPNRDEKGRALRRRSISRTFVNHPIDATRAQQAQERKQSEIENEKEEEFDRLHIGHRYNHDTKEYGPWGKDFSHVDSRGNARRFPRSGENGIYEFVDPNAPGEVFSRKHIGGGGEPLMGEHGERLTRKPGNLTTTYSGRKAENVPMVATPDQIKRLFDGKTPWGKPGAGAPLKDDAGNVMRNVKGTMDKERTSLTQTEASNIARAKELYRSQLQEAMVSQRNLRDRVKDVMMHDQPGVESPWFTKGKVGRPSRDPETGLMEPQKRVFSDITARKLPTNLPGDQDVESYYREFKDQADKRRRMRLEDREQATQLAAKHFEKFNSIFCKPRGDGVYVRRRFFTRTAPPQQQVQVYVPPPHTKAIFRKRILRRRDTIGDSMGTSLRSYIPDDVIKTTDDVTKKNDITLGSYSVNAKEQEREVKADENGLCEKCPLMVGCQDQKVVTSLLPSRGIVSPDASKGCSANVKTEMSSVKMEHAKPSPYRVIAPWSIDR